MPEFDSRRGCGRPLRRAALIIRRALAERSVRHPRRRGRAKGAVATVADVQVIARTQAWHFDPPDLETKATPILLELTNNSDRSIVVRYDHIALTDAAGHRIDVIPPYNVQGTVSVPVTVQQPDHFAGDVLRSRPVCVSFLASARPLRSGGG